MSVLGHKQGFEPAVPLYIYWKFKSTNHNIKVNGRGSELSINYICKNKSLFFSIRSPFFQNGGSLTWWPTTLGSGDAPDSYCTWYYMLNDIQYRFFIISCLSLFVDKIPKKIVEEKSLFFNHDGRIYVCFLQKCCNYFARSMNK